MPAAVADAAWLTGSSAGTCIRLAAGCVLFGGADCALEYYEDARRSIPTTPLRARLDRLSCTRSRTASARRSRCSTALRGSAPRTTPRLHFNRGVPAAGAATITTAAIDAFERALAINPDHDRALLRAGAVADLAAAARRGGRAARAQHEAAADEPVRLVSARPRPARPRQDATKTRERSSTISRSSSRRSRAQLARETGLPRQRRCHERAAGMTRMPQTAVARSDAVGLLRPEQTCLYSPHFADRRAVVPTGRAPRTQGSRAARSARIARGRRRSTGGACHAVDREASGVLEQESPHHRDPAVHLVRRDVRHRLLRPRAQRSTSSAGRSRSTWRRRAR